MKHLVSLVLIILFSACSNSPSSTVEKVAALHLGAIEGEIKTYFSEGKKDRAEATLNLLEHSATFFEEQFQINQTFSIAVLDSADWQKITPIPYGLPFVSGPPHLVCIPADSQNELSRTLATVIEGQNLNKRYGISDEEIVNLFVSLIGFHELGHMYANAYGISFPNRWTFEFTATYFAYVYLDENFSKERDLWIDVSNLLVDALNPRYTSLKDFEEKYTGVGVLNYAWYQVVFLQQVDQLYKKQGKTFLQSLRNYPWPATSTTEYVHEMEQAGSGFTKWAQRYNMLLQADFN